MPPVDHACGRFTDGRRSVPSGGFRSDRSIGCDRHQRNDALARIFQAAPRLPLGHRAKRIHRFGNLLG